MSKDADIKNPANKAGIQTIVNMWKANLHAEGVLGADRDLLEDDETYQKGAGLIAINPATIMGALLVNDKDLADRLDLGDAAERHGGAVRRGWCHRLRWKKAKQSTALEALEFFMKPENLLQKYRSRLKGASCRSTAIMRRATSGRRVSSPSWRTSPTLAVFATGRLRHSRGSPT